MDIKTVNTDSWLFKIYAKQLSRTWVAFSTDDVMRRETNVCDFADRIFRQSFHWIVLRLIIIAGGVFAGLLILAPLMTALLWAITDNGWIPFFGDLGRGLMAIDFVIVVLAAFGFSLYGLQQLASKSTQLTPVDLAVTWVKNKHNKFCTKIKFNKV